MVRVRRRWSAEAHGAVPRRSPRAARVVRRLRTAEAHSVIPLRPRAAGLL